MKRLPNICCVIISFLIAFAALGAAESFAIGETSRTEHQITQGVTESTVYVTVDGGSNVRAHILRISGDAGVEIKASYGGYYGLSETAEDRKDKASQWSDEDWTFESVRNQAIDYTGSADAKGEVIAASNGDFFDIDTGEPEGSLVIEGNVLRRNRKRPFFAVLKNGNVVIRRTGGKLSDVADAVSGKPVLVWKGKIAVDRDDERKPREAIGICEDGTVVIVSVDGREPASPSITLYEMAEIMKAQNCRSALNFDGGGSASFMTKRIGDSELEFRSNHSDGPERNVGPALLVVRKGSEGSDTPDGSYAVRMKNSSTRLWKNSKGTYRYRINGKRPTGFYLINGESYLFSKGKGVTASVKIGKTTYRFVKGKLGSSSDKKAGNVVIGYCGASGEDGRNLLYAYHYGDRRLNIGINPLSKTADGRMKRWSRETVLAVPWYSVRADIEKLYIGNGVKNLGDYSLYSTKGYMTGGAAAPVCRLRSIRMPSSLKTIGAFSLYNKPEMSDVTIPSGVKTIRKYAFAYSGRGTLSFKGKSPPALKTACMKKTGFKTMYVRQSKAWKDFVKKKGFKKYGYKKTVKYK